MTYRMVYSFRTISKNQKHQNALLTAVNSTVNTGFDDLIMKLSEIGSVYTTGMIVEVPTIDELMVVFYCKIKRLLRLRWESLTLS